MDGSSPRELPARDRGHSPRDQPGLRRANLALVLRALREHGPHSRAGLSRLTGLNKATTSSLVAELEQRRLVRLGDAVPNQFGRPGHLVELRPAAVCGIGLEVNVDYLAVAVVDLPGNLVEHRRIAADVVALGQDRALDRLAELAEHGLAHVRGLAGWVSGITAAVPALVDSDNGVVRFAPNLGWRELPVVEGLARRLGLPADQLGVHNDANLSALAEYAHGVAAGSGDLLYLTGEVGVGGGVIAGGQLLRGATGFTGEVGHMPLDPTGTPCGCGRRGCWETQVGLAALLRAVGGPDDEVTDPSLDLEGRLAVVKGRAEAGDPRTLAALRQIGSALGVGASILVNVLNPTAVVLGGYFATLGEWLVEPALAELSGRVLAPERGGCALVLSDLGFTAAVRGGGYAALERVFDDPTLVPPGDSPGAGPGEGAR
ncbi:ROK family protein [Goodfellowiella coeruleoviolacea]|uniref:Sugar kinase of the NBD/HSP70 family, may containing an N-terminal HTH domain n=1 Tax=Goodfellowiella coeruleoviolacea TaxID=334858 RepID=A0AAE3GC78_9PSEU|nr:ROK family transcriptional regulator [Goodfellowiella coeruleoviolacea]MCP2165445.1 Sugar kinase of the NBD/HSP70 family, may containing an N-terminal HTH domain [Goodfellowiella coeruleoviolacea]